MQQTHIYGISIAANTRLVEIIVLFSDCLSNENKKTSKLTTSGFLKIQVLLAPSFHVQIEGSLYALRNNFSTT